MLAYLADEERCSEVVVGEANTRPGAVMYSEIVIDTLFVLDVFLFGELRSKMSNHELVLAELL